MKSEDVDKVIAEALAESKRQSKWHRPKHSTSTETARKILNTVFMIGFVAAVVIYFAMPENKTLFFCVGFGSIILKLIEFYLRFVL